MSRANWSMVCSRAVNQRAANHMPRKPNTKSGAKLWQNTGNALSRQEKRHSPAEFSDVNKPRKERQE